MIRYLNNQLKNIFSARSQIESYSLILIKQLYNCSEKSSELSISINDGILSIDTTSIYGFSVIKFKTGISNVVAVL